MGQEQKGIHEANQVELREGHEEQVGRHGVLENARQDAGIEIAFKLAATVEMNSNGLLVAVIFFVLEQGVLFANIVFIIIFG